MISETGDTPEIEAIVENDTTPIASAAEKADALATSTFPIAELRKVAEKINGRDYIARIDFAAICDINEEELRKRWQKRVEFGILKAGVGNKVYYRFDYAMAFLLNYHQVTVTQKEELVEKTHTKTGSIERRRTNSMTIRPPLKPREVAVQQDIVVRPAGAGRLAKVHYGVDDGRRVFKLLDDGLTPSAIVQKLKLHPITIEAIWKDWTALRQGFVVEGAVRTTIETILRELMVSIPKPMATQADLRDNLLAMKHQVFSEAEVQRATQCARCIHKGRMAVNKAEVCLRCANDISDQLLFKEGLRHRKTPNFETYFHQEKGARK